MQATMRKATIFPSSVCTQPKTFYSNTLPTFPHSESASCRALVDDKRKKSFFRLYGNEKKFFGGILTRVSDEGEKKDSGEEKSVVRFFVVCTHFRVVVLSQKSGPLVECS